MKRQWSGSLWYLWNFKISKKVVPTLSQFAMDRDLDFIQLIDDDVLTANAAFDEQTMMETLTERLQECRGYNKSMLIVDLDSLVGVSISESISNMGPSTSSSFVRQNLFSWVCNALNRAQIVNGIEHWVFVIVSHPFSAQSLRKMVKFPFTSDERMKSAAKKGEETIPVTCSECKVTFLRSENKFGDCKIHKINPPITMSETDKEKFVHSCCGAKYSPGTQYGCVLNWHKYNEWSFDL